MCSLRHLAHHDMPHPSMLPTCRPPNSSRAGDRLPAPRPGHLAGGIQHEVPADPSIEARRKFVARIRALPAMAALHISIDQSERHAKILANLLQQIAEGDEEACALEESHIKLLLSPIPRGNNTRVEFDKRLHL